MDFSWDKVFGGHVRYSGFLCALPAEGVNGYHEPT